MTCLTYIYGIDFDDVYKAGCDNTLSLTSLMTVYWSVSIIEICFLCHLERIWQLENRIFSYARTHTQT